MVKPRGSAHAPADGASPRGAKMNDEQKVICKKKKIITLFIETPANMRIGVPRSDTAFLQRECAVVSEQVSIMEEAIGKAENRRFAHARRL